MFILFRNKVVIYSYCLGMDRCIHSFSAPLHKVPDNQTAADKLRQTILDTHHRMLQLKENNLAHSEFLLAHEIVMLHTAIGAYGLAVTNNWAVATKKDLLKLPVSPSLKSFESDANLSDTFEKQCRKFVGCIEKHLAPKPNN
jgi:hypothetical protein